MKKEVYVFLGLEKLEQIQVNGQFNPEKIAAFMSSQIPGINPEGSTNSQKMEFAFSGKLKLYEKYNYLCLIKAETDEKNLLPSDGEFIIFSTRKPHFEPKDICNIVKICETVKLTETEYFNIQFRNYPVPNLPIILNESIDLREQSRKEHLNTLRILADDSNKESVGGFALLPKDMKCAIALFLGSEARSSEENYKLVQFMFANVNELSRAVKTKEIAQVKITVGRQDVRAVALQLVASQSFFNSATSVVSLTVDEAYEVQNGL